MPRAMPQPRSQPFLERTNLLFWLFWAVVAVNIWFHADALPLFHEEPRRAIIAQEMLLTGDYVTPKVYQTVYNKKPPLQNWLIALSAAHDGRVSNLDARLPSIVAYLALMASVFMFLRRAAPELANAPLGALAATTPVLMFVDFSRKSEPDMLLTVLVFLAYTAYTRMSGWAGLALSAAAMGLSILAKGVGPLFFYPGLVLHALIFTSERWQRLKRLGLHALLALLVPGAWLLTYYLYGDINTLLAGFTSEVGARTGGGVGDYFNHVRSFPLEVLAALLPWPLIGLCYWRRVRWTQHDTFRESACIALAAFCILLASTGSIDRYYMPAFPFIGMLFAFWLKDPAQIIPWVRTAFIGVFLAACLGCAVFLAFNGPLLQTLWLLVPAVGLVMYHRMPANGLAANLLIMFGLAYLVVIHGYYAAKVVDSYDHAPLALKVEAALPGKSIPVLVDARINPIRLAFNLTRDLGQPIASTSVAKPSRYALLSPDAQVKNCRRLGSFTQEKGAPKHFSLHMCGK
jgi:4-amino-4-deoxy-L-arabinose transferase-like glycosyltransferase